MKLPKTTSELQRDRRVRQVWNEGPDGWWCLLDGYRNDEGGHTLHEWSVKALLSAFASAVARGPCGCDECVARRARARRAA